MVYTTECGMVYNTECGMVYIYHRMRANEIATITDPRRATNKYPKAAGSIIVGISIYQKRDVLCFFREGPLPV